MVNERLFDESRRSDGSPGRHTEKSFHFLNRRAGAFWDRVRSHLESCYADFPNEHKRGLVSRLREDDERQHLPAWWELYTFTLFNQLGYTIEVPPETARQHQENPDFLVTKGTLSMYVEAAVVFNDEPNSDAWNWVCDYVNDAESDGFMVDLEIPTVGARRPAARKIIEPLEKWLASLDADHALADQDARRPLPRGRLPPMIGSSTIPLRLSYPTAVASVAAESLFIQLGPRSLSEMSRSCEKRWIRRDPSTASAPSHSTNH